ncbi:MAG: ferrous iron transport protein B [Paludibacteraceae bacterium]|nr:ferrous iron transport protein B [Prevotella sp.]MBQ8152693.1 ferrous iron transport protein B [Prevotella sp.]MBQ8705883.1 ferrous iron transport protein B [Paludibacteraceae bacterium]MBQ8714454.1 ferrous iron transport protein B [Prevotella sp.]
MRLSDLKTGEHGVIVKVQGHGGFRKRIIEMGFIRGKEVEVLLNAPLQDPVKYKVMGYEVSLRRQEADMIEVVPPPAKDNHSGQPKTMVETFTLHSNEESEVINVALVGNPNCGKTSLFNFASGAHERVGNYSGVTVDAKEGYADFEGYRIKLVDLPGTYSLSAYSPEELYVRKQLVEDTPDVIINVIDSSNLERNLYLTTQLMDMHLRVVVALNMYDELEQRGDHLNIDTLSTLLGMPMVPTSFKTGWGLDELMHEVIHVFENREGHDQYYRHIHISHGHEIEDGISHIQQFLKGNDLLRLRYSTRWLAIKLLENDKKVEEVIRVLPEAQQIIWARDLAAHRVKEETGDDTETAIMDAKYGFIRGALQEAGYEMGHKDDTYKVTHKLDALITSKWLGFPIFLLLLFLMFEVTFALGQYPMDWIEMGVEWLGDFVGNHLADGPLKAMLVDGCIGGVGAVIVFLPQILILYTFISFMEDSGYMARAAFIMDKLMHGMGLHGKSFIPLIMGFGCNVPAVMATRTIESRRSRLITMLVLPMMSCSARLPIYIMITGAFFAVKYQGLVMISLYVVGIILSVVMARVLSTWVIKGEDTPFVMELPPYRFPTAKAIFRHTWEKGKQYLKKMGGIILVASIIVWALGYFGTMGVAPSLEESFIGMLGKLIEPLFYAQGFDWRLDISLLAGVGAKEIVASTIGVLYGDGVYNFTPLVAYSFLLFVLIYFPCIATIVAIKHESGSWKWAIFAALYTTVLAWIVSAAVYQIGSLF